MKTVSEAHVGDTFYIEGTHKDMVEPLSGYASQKHMVFAGIYPEDPGDYEELEKALQKLCLTDGSVSVTYESSAALGSGFRCGFLGMLHMDVFRQRLADEHSVSSIITTPTVAYQCKLINSPDILYVENPLEGPKSELIKYWEEQITNTSIITPADYANSLKKLCEEKRGVQKRVDYIDDGKLVQLQYEIPLAELVTNFFDLVKSLSSGYASLDYEFLKWEASDIVKVVFYINHEPVDALTFLVHRSNSLTFAKQYCKRLKELLPPQLFKIALQGKIGGKVIAREE